MASKNYRKFMATGITAAVVASAVAPVASAATFTDVPAGAWYKQAVDYVSGKGYMTGTSATTFAPTKDITRAEAATLFANKLDLYKDGQVAGFADVKTNAWYHNAVAAVKEGNIMGSTGDNMFAPNRNITRGEVAALIVRAYGLTGTGASHSFTDVDNSIFKNDISTLVEWKIADGKSATKFAPTDLVSRAEMAAFIQKADEATAKAEVTAVSAINATDLKVELRGKVSGLEITKDDFEVKVNDTAVSFNVKKVSDLEYTLELATPLQEGDKVVVTGLTDLKDSSASTVYKTLEISKVEAVESVVYDGEAGQYLAIKADGKEMTASDLAKQGYEVKFQASLAVFPSGATTSTTGLIDGSAAALVTGTPFNYKVTITKNNKVVDSAYAKVSVFDKSLTAASSISSVTLSTTAMAEVTSGKVVVGEAGLAVSEVVADLMDGRKNVDLVGLTGTVDYSSSDVTIATVNASGQITAKKAGTVQITVKSGKAEKVLNLTVVNEARKLNTVTYSGTGVKVVKGGSASTVSISAKDQYGDIYNTAAIQGDLTVVEATASGNTLSSSVVNNNAVSPTWGGASVTVTPSATSIGSGQVKLVDAAGSKTFATIPVSVISPTAAVTTELSMNRTTIDLNAGTSSNPSITFTLQEFLSGHYNQDVNLNTGGYVVEVYDAGGTKIYDGTPSGAGVTVTRADLIAETAGAAAIGQASTVVDTALAAGTTSIANFETGTGLIKVYDAGKANLVASKNFSISDTSANISAATFASGVDFTAANATTLKLSELLSSVSTTASKYDGVIRYEALAGSDELVVFFDSAASPDGYQFANGDILLGTVLATDLDGNNVTLADGANYVAGTATITSSGLSAEDRVQFNVNKRGDVSVAKTTITKK